MAALKNPKADLRNKYNRYLKISFMLSIALIILAFKFSPEKGKVKIIKEKAQERIIVEETINTTQETKIPEPPKAPEIIIANTEDDITDIEMDDISIDEKENMDKPGPPIDDKPMLEDENIVHIVVEEMPQIIGGTEALYEKLYYTEIAKKAGIEGKVIVETVIDKNGNPTEIKLIKGIGGGLNEVALDAVRDTKFTPGIQSGKQVRVRMVIPIKFVLK